eukprot:TRINITY_DN73212_c0_g1_i1.p1 TRINITY_DN73212_c0_g1~~TRINITY_DN73212_c0_g1_i1.p1  ORF type:complete len:399 (-),score=110.60 TRINITY_DN73212_c0_g1_i1:162-1358(-)
MFARTADPEQGAATMIDSTDLVSTYMEESEASSADEGGVPKPLRKCLGCCGCCCFLTLFILLCCSFATVPPLSYGLLKNNFNKRVDLTQVYEPGIYLVGFFKGFELFPSSVSTIQYSYSIPEAGVQHNQPLFLRSADAQPMHLELSVQYYRQKEGLTQLYQRAMTPQLQEDFYISNVRSQLTKVMSKHKASDCWQARSALIADFMAACKQVMAENFGVCWGLQFYRSHMDPKYEDALVRTQVQKQNVLIEAAKKRAAEVRAKTEVVVSNYTKAIQVIEATGKAQRYNIEKGATSMAEANKTLAQVQAIEHIRANVKNGGMSPNDAELAEYMKLVMLMGDLQKPQLFAGLGNAGAKEYVLMPPGAPRRLPEATDAAAAASMPLDAAPLELRSAASLPEL